MARAGLASRTSEPLKVHRSARSYSLLDTGRAPSSIERAIGRRARYQDTERAPSGYPHHWQSNSEIIANFRVRRLCGCQGPALRRLTRSAGATLSKPQRVLSFRTFGT